MLWLIFLLVPHHSRIQLVLLMFGDLVLVRDCWLCCLLFFLGVGVGGGPSICLFHIIMEYTVHTEGHNLFLARIRHDWQIRFFH